MWNEEELLAEVDAYFDSVTEEEFMDDVLAAGCIDMIEEVMLPKHKHTYSVNTSSAFVTIKTTEEVRIEKQEFNKMVLSLKAKQKIINKQNPKNNFYKENIGIYTIGA